MPRFVLFRRLTGQGIYLVRHCVFDNLTVCQALDGSGVLQARQRAFDFALGEVSLVLNLVQVEWSVVIVYDLSDIFDVTGADGSPTGEEALKSQILGTVEEKSPGRLAVSSGSPDLLIIG